MKPAHKTLTELNEFAKKAHWGDKDLANCSRRELLDCIFYMTEALTRANAIVNQMENRKKNSLRTRAGQLFRKFRVTILKDVRHADNKKSKPDQVTQDQASEHTAANAG